MKKLLTIIFTLIWMPMTLFSQSYDALWKEADQAKKKDLPKTEQAVVRKIIAKARQQRAYGQLLKAQLRDAQITVEISPDSASVALERIEQQAAETQASEPIVSSVLYNVLGAIYRDSYGDESSTEKSPRFFSLSLANPTLLASHQDAEFKPVVEIGKDSRIFQNDMLSVLGYQAREFEVLHQYYESVGNRAATMLTALELLKKDENYSLLRKYNGSAIEAKFDSLMNKYGDLPECGEVARECYHRMDRANDVTVAQKVAFLENALERWGTWPPMNELRNARNALSAASYSVNTKETRVMPGMPVRFEVRGRNVKTIMVSVTRLDLNGNTPLQPENNKDFATIKTKLQKETKRTLTAHFSGLKDYEWGQDTLVMEPLPVGVYLLESSSDEPGTGVSRNLLYVSDLYVISQHYPDKKVRYAVVSATTGQPKAGAKICLRNSRRYGKETKSVTLTCGADGEVVHSIGDAYMNSIYPYTSEDKAFMATNSSWGSYTYYDAAEGGEDTMMDIYTDRKIYRPGQTVHVSLLVFKNKNRWTTEVKGQSEVTLQLRDANHQLVKETKLMTDEFGTASTDFVLPANGLTGMFHLRTTHGNAYESIRVEEYKRPTFQVEFDEVKEAYTAGDTITVVGRAKSFAGVPVQGAKVNYTITRRQSLWCWWMRWGARLDEELGEGTAVTDEKGEFRVRMPMILPGWEDTDGEMDEEEFYRIPRFYQITAHADVTDQAGETREGQCSVPLGSKPTAFYCNIPERSEKNTLKEFSFTFKNAAGTDIEGTVSYTIDGKDRRKVAANKPVPIDTRSLKSGRHVIAATCGNDTLKKEFVVFSLADKRPCVETSDWFFQTASVFPREGGEVTVQVGTSDLDTHVFYSVFSGNNLLESGSFELNNSIHTKSYTYQEQYGSGLLITYAWVKNGKCYTHNATIQRPLPDKRLHLKWTTFRDRLVPGQQETWTLNITHTDGKPAKAQLLAAMFDKSLDEIVKHNWSLYDGITQNLPSTSWTYPHNYALSGSGTANFKYLKVEQLRFSSFEDDLLNIRRPTIIGFGRGRVLMSKAAVSMTADEESMAAKNVAYETFDQADGTQELKEVMGATVKQSLDTAPDEETKVQVRENLNETAFFYPTLLTDEDGNVDVRFTLPESVTTWRFMGLAHDRQMYYGMIDGEAVAQKDVMVQPNVPRFVREGDQAKIATRLINTTDRAISGTVRLQLLDPETEKVLYEESHPFTVHAESTTSATFDYTPDGMNPLLVCRVIATGDGFSDGEQHYLPVLPNREMVMNTVPFTQHTPGRMTVDIDKLIPESVRNASKLNQLPRLTVEYTNNPVWLMVQALPFVGDAKEENAVSQAAAFYANSLGAYILQQSPDAQKVFSLWQQERGDETSLMSSLEKNQELKTLVLNETPWVMDAKNERDQKQALANYFDQNRLESQISSNLATLKKLQNSDGSFSWWKGMDGSPSMTATVAEFLTRLNLMTGEQSSTRKLLEKAQDYLSDVVKREVAEMKKREKEKKPVYVNSYRAVQWLYMNAISGRELSASERDAKTWLMKYLAKEIRTQSLYLKAMMAVVLEKDGQQKKSREYIQSLKEYTVYKEEMGRYYDTPRAGYSWCDYRIPTQTVVIEALKMITPEDEVTISEMQRWLLMEKRTQAWDTPINSVNAIHAFLDGKAILLESKVPATLAIDGQTLELPNATAGLGYVKTTIPVVDSHVFTADKQSEGTSWGAVYAQFLQPVTEVTDATSGLSIKREIIGAEKPLSVGDRVKVRITITADRDYDFVQVIDQRAACLEPINQLSGYHWGYYCAPKDCTTNYYFDVLSKGTHEIEVEYYIDRAGIYQTGVCTVQCAYSPEYYGRSSAKVIEVRN